MTEYVLGFLFNQSYETVLMIEKARPEWQKGLLNGIGGHIEEGETPLEAMDREAKEEAGLSTMNWKLFAVMEGPGGKVHCFKARLMGQDIHPDYGGPAVQPEDGETLYEAYVETIRRRDGYPMLSNIPWLIDMAFDQNYEKPVVFHIRYGEPQA